MKSFIQFIKELLDLEEATFSRMGPTSELSQGGLRDFSKPYPNLPVRRYKFLNQGNSRATGPVETGSYSYSKPREFIPGLSKGGVTIGSGTFAGPESLTAMYAARSKDFVRHTDPATGEDVVTYNEKDKPAVMKARAVVSTWSGRDASKANFNPTNNGDEVMSANAGRPTKQKVVNSIDYMRQNGLRVDFHPDLQQHIANLRDQGIDYTSEGKGLQPKEEN